MMRPQWHQLDHMQIIFTLLQTDNHASTSALSFYRPYALPAAQPTASKHWRPNILVKSHLVKRNCPDTDLTECSTCTSTVQKYNKRHYTPLRRYVAVIYNVACCASNSHMQVGRDFAQVNATYIQLGATFDRTTGWMELQQQITSIVCTAITDNTQSLSLSNLSIRIITTVQSVKMQTHAELNGTRHYQPARQLS